MKKVVLFLVLFIWATSFGKSQETNVKNYVYCELVGTGKLLSNKVNVQVDFGQKTSFWKGVDYLKDDQGKKLEFNSMVDAMNYFGSQGWEFIQAYVVSIPGMAGQQNVYHWLLKKEISQEQVNTMEKELKKEE